MKILIVALLLSVSIGCRAGTIDSYPIAEPLNGSEQLLAAQDGETVTITPRQLATYTLQFSPEPVPARKVLIYFVVTFAVLALASIANSLRRIANAVERQHGP